MFNKKFLRLLALLACLGGIFAIARYSAWRDSVSCMGVRILTVDALSSEYAYHDYSESLRFHGEKAAVDVDSATIYISQPIGDSTKFTDLEGELVLDALGHSLYFLPDPAFEDLNSAVETGHEFRLAVTNGSGEHMLYDVIFSTLPVLRLDGEYLYADEEDRAVQSGAVTLWASGDAELGRSTVKSGMTHWHIRGQSTVNMAKKSWKLSLKKSNGTNRDEAFLNLGGDDDWILNSMSMDDTKLKERLFLELWNALAESGSGNLKMSEGEYVEAVINGRYDGVYLLQRRVDEKYLGLSSEDILMKGKTVWEAATAAEGYEIVSSPLDGESTYSALETAHIDPENFVDVSLFLQFASAPDNTGYKNMFYAVLREGGGYRMTMIPWDTDMSLGVVWMDGFAYDFEKSLQTVCQRMEYPAMLAADPEMPEKLSARWAQLRGGVLSTENVLAVLTQLEAQLVNSGALERDQKKWGAYYGGGDTLENLHRFVEERLTWLDAYYE